MVNIRAELTVMYTIAPPNGDNAKLVESQLLNKGMGTNGDER